VLGQYPELLQGSDCLAILRNITDSAPEGSRGELTKRLHFLERMNASLSSYWEWAQEHAHAYHHHLELAENVLEGHLSLDDAKKAAGPPLLEANHLQALKVFLAAHSADSTRAVNVLLILNDVAAGSSAPIRSLAAKMLAGMLLKLEHYAAAASAFEIPLAIAREERDIKEEANARWNLGKAQALAGRHREANASFRATATMRAALKQRSGEITAWCCAAQASVDLREPGEALDCAQNAVNCTVVGEPQNLRLVGGTAITVLEASIGREDLANKQRLLYESLETVLPSDALRKVALIVSETSFERNHPRLALSWLRRARQNGLPEEFAVVWADLAFRIAFGLLPRLAEVIDVLADSVFVFRAAGQTVAERRARECLQAAALLLPRSH
jgi:hypothetical protein